MQRAIYALAAYAVMLVLAVNAAQQAPAAGSQTSAEAAGVTLLPAKTEVHLRVRYSLSSAFLAPGQPVELVVVRDVRVGNLLVVAHDSRAIARVAESHGARRFLIGGRLVLQLESVKTITGDDVPLRATLGKQGGEPGTDQLDALQLLGLPLVARGEEAVVREHTPIDAFVDADVSLDTSRYREAGAALEAKAAAARAASRTGNATVHLYCNHATRGGGIVELDGQRMIRLRWGVAYNIAVPPGHHVFRSRSHDWALDVSADEEYYVRFRLEGFWKPYLQAALVSKEDGQDQSFGLSAPDDRDILTRVFNAPQPK
jgi:hypothetical protein